MRHPFLLFTLCSASAVLAQAPDKTAEDALVAARARLHKALTTTAALPACGFTADWGASKDPAGKDAQPGPANAALLGAVAKPDSASGCWADGLLFAKLGNDEFVAGNRRMLARNGQGAWTVRRGRYSEGGTLSWLPDPQLALDQLQRWELAVTHREVGALGDRPVEFLSVTLDPDQVAEAVWSGLLPDPGFSGPGGGGMVFRAMAIGGGPAAPAVAKPAATVDIAFAIDPGTNQLQGVAFRIWTDATANPFNRLIRGNAGAVVVVNGQRLGGNGGEEEEDDDDKAAKTKDGKPAPLTYKNGLPERSRKKKSVEEVTFVLREHGTAKAPALDDKAKALLGGR